MVRAGITQVCLRADADASAAAAAAFQIERLVLSAYRTIPVAARTLGAVERAGRAVLGPIRNADVLAGALLARTAVVVVAAAPVDRIVGAGIGR